MNFAVVPFPASLVKAVFHFSRIVAKRTVFHCFVIWTNDMDTIEYATFRYDTVEVENAL